MSAETDNQSLLYIPTLTDKLLECIDLLCNAHEAHQIDVTTTSNAMNAMMDALSLITSGEATTTAELAKLKAAVPGMRSADTDKTIDPNWVE